MSLQRLLEIASSPLGSPCGEITITADYGVLGWQLAKLLSTKNGFFAFESALHIFPAEPALHGRSLEDWNDRELWRCEFRGLADDILFFGEDAFAHQFCIKEASICSFDSETGECKELARSFEDWAKLMLNDYDFQTGYPLLHDWQEKHGQLGENQRLIPKLPFVLGGEYNLGNLVSMDAKEAMQARGNIAWQIQDVPEGAEVEIVLGDYPFKKSG